MIYLDNAATTKMHLEVFNAMRPYLLDEFGNPGTMYELGRNAREAVDKARCQVARTFNCEPEQIVFTSGGSEGNNMVLRGVSNYLYDICRPRILISDGEHDSVYNTAKWEMFADRVPLCKEGTINLTALENMVTFKTGLVSAMYSNNETGAVNPVQEISEICKRKNVLFHTDCVQAAGFYDLDVQEIGCDFATISSHKIHGPKGVGAVYIKNRHTISSIIDGGADQEFGMRGGTENVAGIVGFGKACEMFMDNMKETRTVISELKQRFFIRLNETLRSIGENEVVAVGQSPIGSGKILNLFIKGVDAQTFVLAMDGAGICISAGSACRSRETLPSRVLTSMGLSPDEARQCIRVSFSSLNTQFEIDTAAESMASYIAAMRKL